MSETEQIDLFNDRLDKLMATFCDEYDVSKAALIGALYLKIHQLAEAKKD